MRISSVLLKATWAAWLLCGAAAAGPLPSFEQAAGKAQDATVTVRVHSLAPGREQGEPSLPKVTVFSGVSLGNGLIVTPLFTTDGARIRVTIAGGEQTEAQPKVLDEHSGLALLEVDKTDLPRLPLAEQAPSAGAWVISTAAWGVEKPVVSFGMLSGIDRRMPGTTYPPMLQCNITAAETSSGAPLVNAQGELLGIIVAADAPDLDRGWTFAVPVRHVRRLLRVYAERFRPNRKSDEVVILKRRRPIVGMEIGGQLDRVIVKRVFANGPAYRAGIRVGDRIIAVDGVKIRSPYQAVGPTLFKQPGDTVTFLIGRGDQQRAVEVVLGGGVALPAAGGLQLSHLIEPKLIVDKLALREALRRQKRDRAEVYGDRGAPEANQPDRQKLLQEALERYQTVVDLQQSRLVDQQQKLDRAEDRIRALEAELAELRRRLDKVARPKAD